MVFPRKFGDQLKIVGKADQERPFFAGCQRPVITALAIAETHALSVKRNTGQDHQIDLIKRDNSSANRLVNSVTPFRHE